MEIIQGFRPGDKRLGGNWPRPKSDTTLAVLKELCMAMEIAGSFKSKEQYRSHAHYQPTYCTECPTRKPSTRNLVLVREAQLWYIMRRGLLLHLQFQAFAGHVRMELASKENTSGVLSVLEPCNSHTAIQAL